MKPTKKLLCIGLLLTFITGIATGCGKKAASEETPVNEAAFPASAGTAYTIPQLDLNNKPSGIDAKYDYLYQSTVLDDTKDYVAHPDSVLLRNGDILTVYPLGHGKGAIQSKLSTDGGATWGTGIAAQPKSWKKSKETPTIYRVSLQDGTEKLVLVSANPDWGNGITKGGFRCSVSTDEGATWTEFQQFWGKKEKGGVSNTIVAMASLTQLKENGRFVDKWMGLFHDNAFHNYKTILTFDGEGNPHWSQPVRYFEQYRDVERLTGMCEVEVIRSENSTGDQLCLLARSNTKKYNSVISFSDDEGVTWSQPREVPPALNGERHKADYTSDGRLFITFRSIERDAEKIRQFANDNGLSEERGWYSEGWVAWVGTYEDLVKGTEGQYRIKLAHTYLKGQTEPAVSANPDTGYCGNVVLPDGTIVTSSYGCFDPAKTYKSKGELTYKTSIVSKQLRLADIDALAEQLYT